jgi:hypothetical protein
MFRYVLHLSLGRHQDGIRSRAKSAEFYLELPLGSYPVVLEIPNIFTTHTVLDVSPQKESPSVKDLGFWEARELVRRSQSRR